MVMSPALQVLLCVVGVVLVAGQQCNETECVKFIYDHYKVKNCMPVGDPCCPDSFDCPPEAADPSWCKYKGRTYTLHRYVPVDHICAAGCFCIPSDTEEGPAYIQCTEKECPRWLEFSFVPCRYKYTLDKCCEVDKDCGTEPKPETVNCSYEGQNFVEGEEMYFMKHCRKCICDAKFKDPWGPGCETVNCGFHLRHSRELTSGCAPVYYEDMCCPIDWLCDGDRRLPHSVAPLEEAECHLGEFGAPLNHTFQLSICEIRCGCITPPELTCIHHTSCDNARDNPLFP